MFNVISKLKKWFLSDEIEKIIKETKASVLEAVGNMAPPKSFVDDEVDDSAYKSWKSFIDKNMELNASDRICYTDYNNMDVEVPELSQALDVNAEFITYPSETDKIEIFKVKHKSARVQKQIESMLKRINFKQVLFSIIRNTLKYGDNFEELITDREKTMVVELRNIPIETMIPNVKNGIINPDSAYIQVTDTGETVANFKKNEVFHLSLCIDRERWTKYRKGLSILHYSRLSYRQLRLMEEGLMISRLSRANQNYAMMLDVGNLEGDDAINFIKKYKQQLLRRKYIDPKTGKWSWEYNPLSVIEDIILPTRQGSGANVVTLNNSSNTGKNIEDIEYHQNKMIYSTHTPKIFIGKETDINSKSTSDVQMTTFLRKIRRFQMIYEPQLKQFIVDCMGVEKITIFPDEFTIEWPISNFIDEERKWKIEKLKLDVASILSEMALVDDLYIYTKIMGMTDDEAQELMDRLDTEEENYKDELDAMLATADDKSDLTAKEFENQPDDDNKDDKDEDEEPTKEDILAALRTKLGEEKFNEWIKIQKILDKHPEIKHTLAELVMLTQAKLFQ